MVFFAEFLVRENLRAAPSNPNPNPKNFGLIDDRLIVYIFS